MRIHGDSREASRIDTAGTAQAASTLDIPALPAISLSPEATATSQVQLWRARQPGRATREVLRSSATTRY
jgi:hypothetical protein